MKEAEISLWFPMSSFKEIQVKQKKNTHISLENILYLEKTLC